MTFKEVHALMTMKKKASATQQWMQMTKKAVQDTGIRYWNPNGALTSDNVWNPNVDENHPTFKKWLASYPNATAQQKQAKKKEIAQIIAKQRDASITSIKQDLDQPTVTKAKRQEWNKDFQRRAERLGLDWFGRYMSPRQPKYHLLDLKYRAKLDPKTKKYINTSKDQMQKQYATHMNRLGYSHFGGGAAGGLLGAGLGYYLTDNPVLRLLLAAGGGYLGMQGGSYLGRLAYNKLADTGLKSQFNWNPVSNRIS